MIYFDFVSTEAVKLKQSCASETLIDLRIPIEGGGMVSFPCTNVVRTMPQKNLQNHKTICIFNCMVSTS